jgi:hypothetical protein
LLSFVAGRSRFERHLSRQVLTWRNARNLLEVTGWTVLAQLLVLGCFVVVIQAFKPQVGLGAALAGAAVVSFVASLPISVNGWGIREIAAVYVFGYLGISGSDAVAGSVMVGLLATLVVVMAFPLVLRARPVSPAAAPRVCNPVHEADIEAGAAWILAMISAVMVFFQFHTTLPGGVVNLNLADPFAILALAAILLHCLATRTLPAWRFPGINVGLLGISAMLLLGFLNGWMHIGVTQWALVGRLFGWLVLMGYLASGYMVVAYSGPHGMRRLAETMMATAGTVVVIQALIRILVSFGLFPGTELSPNFEGYAGNRNAFAFQLLCAVALVVAYLSVYRRAQSGNHSADIVVSLGISVLLAGLVWTGSRTGQIAAILLVVVVWVVYPRERRVTRMVLPLTLLISCLPILISACIGVLTGPVSTPSVQSVWSGEYSNWERMATLVHAVELWQDYPVFGAGLGVFYARSSEWLGHPQVIHSSPFWLLAEFGLVGVTLVGVAVGLLARAAWKSRSRMPQSRALLMLLGLFGFFSLAHEVFYQRIFWFVAGALLVTPYCYRLGEREASPA